MTCMNVDKVRHRKKRNRKETHTALHTHTCTCVYINLYVHIYVCVCVYTHMHVLACPYAVNGSTDTGLQDKVRAGPRHRALVLTQGIPYRCLTRAACTPHSLWLVAFCKSFSIVTNYCAKPLMRGPVSDSSIKLQVTGMAMGRDARRLNRVRQHKITTKCARKYKRYTCVCVCNCKA